MKEKSIDRRRSMLILADTLQHLAKMFYNKKKAFKSVIELCKENPMFLSAFLHSFNEELVTKKFHTLIQEKYRDELNTNRLEKIEKIYVSLDKNL